MKKYIVIGMMLALCAITIVGCGIGVAESSETTPTAAPGNPTIEMTSVPIESGSNTTTDTNYIESTSENNGESNLQKLAFVYQNNYIALFDIVDDLKLESILGKADDILSHTYSQDDGKNMDQLDGMTEKQYVYPGLVIKTIDGAQDKQFFIFSIEITDPKYPTVSNIQVGDSYDKLKEAYPEGQLMGGELGEGEDDFRYEPVNYVDAMICHIKDKKVSSIYIYTLLD